MIAIRQTRLDEPQVAALIGYHQRDMLAASPEGASFALDLSSLSDPSITVFAAWQDGRCAGIGAVKRLGEGAGELKSMRTHPDFTRRGIARAMLDHLIEHSRRQNMLTLSLETGSGEKFEPALALYRQRGFANGAAFGDYRLTEFNQCLHLTL